MRLLALVLILAMPMIRNVSAETTKNRPSALSHCTVPADEMRVLVSYLKWSMDGKTVTVLVTTTEASGVDVDYINLKLAIAGHGTPTDVRKDLKTKQDSKCQIPPITGMQSLRFISQEEHNRLFQKGTGWPMFHQRYGPNARLVTISRVGFNSDKTIALFYATDGIGRMAGGCSLYVFRLREGKWVKDSEASAWQT